MDTNVGHHNHASLFRTKIAHFGVLRHLSRRTT